MPHTPTVTATGLWYTTRSKPILNHTANGIFSMQIHAVDRIGQHCTESWRLIWIGPEAEAFNAVHNTALCTPGQPLRVQVYGLRSLTTGRWKSGEIHAHVHACALAPRAEHLACGAIAQADQTDTTQTAHPETA